MQYNNILDGLHFSAEQVDVQSMPDFEGTHWKYTLATKVGQHGKFEVVFSQGFGHKLAPSMSCVLEVLFMEMGATQEGFEDWAINSGYDTDSRKAYQTYEECRKQADHLVNLLGESFDEVRAVIMEEEE